MRRFYEAGGGAPRTGLPLYGPSGWIAPGPLVPTEPHAVQSRSADVPGSEGSPGPIMRAASRLTLSTATMRH